MLAQPFTAGNADHVETAECRRHDTRLRCQLPAVNCRLSFVGCWLSVVGCRLLVVDCWLPVVAYRLRNENPAAGGMKLPQPRAEARGQRRH